MEEIDDTIRLEWIVYYSILIKKGGECSPDPYYYLIFKNGETSDCDNDWRRLIDREMENNPPV